ncbi:MAG TPA: thiamine pyrophosphate-binding protein [Gaiellaceae bacterium]|nr:thiamine pyrophosphate-binding protein [Gaiellaceae bacterium]
MRRTAARILVDQLLVHAVDTAYCVPGESYLGVLDAIGDSPIRLYTTRHEAAAANMADAYGKLTGRPGVCLVTRAPGATHAAVGIHTAYQDSTPLVLLVGQVPMAHLGREAFQELDYARMFGEMAKWVATLDDPAGVPELVAHAFHVATSGRPGPVVIALPEDVQDGEADVADAAPYVPSRPAADAADVERAVDLLAGSERPLVIVGGGGWSERAGRDVIAFAEASNIPVAASFRRQDYVDNGSRAYAGPLTIGMDPALAGRVREADVILALGTRLGEIATRQYSLLEPPRPVQRLIHAHADPDELGRVYEAELPILSGSTEFAAALRPAGGAERRAAWIEGARTDYLANLRHEPLPGALQLGDVMAHLRARLPADAVLTNGAGNYTVWAHRFYEFRRYGTQLAPCAGAMGYGVPAAIAAKLLQSERPVVCLSGDGDFLMSGHELATAAQYGAAIVVLVVNNGMLGTIRMHQERRFGRGVATELANPDFVAYARSFGAYAELVERGEDFPRAFEAALAEGRPALLELRVDPEAITPRATLSELRGGG